MQGTGEQAGLSAGWPQSAECPTSRLGRMAATTHSTWECQCHLGQAAGHEDGVGEADSGKYSKGVLQSRSEAPTHFKGSLL